MSDRTFPIHSPEGRKAIVAMLVARGDLTPEGGRRVLENGPITQADIEAYADSPFAKMIRTDPEFRERLRKIDEGDK